LTGIHAWQALQKNESITYGEACALYDCLIDSPTNGVKHGNKKKLVAAIDIEYFDHDYLRHYFGLHVDLKNEWYDALLKIPAEIRANYTQMQINKELELDEPRIVLDTFHGAKGTEAENVIVLTDMATQTFELYEKNRDDELRALYVAVTRAKRSLHLITPRQSTAYKDIERMYHDALALPSARALESETQYAETI
jgi:ATP-dependent exoDNAse (exonuclease V) beta subunit